MKKRIQKEFLDGSYELKKGFYEVKENTHRSFGGNILTDFAALLILFRCWLKKVSIEAKEGI